MAVIKQRLLRKNSVSGYDQVWLETGSETSIRPDGTTVEEALTALSTAVNKLSAGASSGSTYNIRSIGLGQIIKFNNELWAICHIASNYLVLSRFSVIPQVPFMLSPSGSHQWTAAETSKWNDSTRFDQYVGSNLETECRKLDAALNADSKAICISTTILGSTGLIYVPTLAELESYDLYKSLDVRVRFASLSSRYTVGSTAYSSTIWLSDPYTGSVGSSGEVVTGYPDIVNQIYMIDSTTDPSRGGYLCDGRLCYGRTVVLTSSGSPFAKPYSYAGLWPFVRIRI